MNHIRTIMLVALSVCAATCGSGADNQDAITGTVLTCVKGIAAGDVDLIASTFAEDATAFFPAKSPARILGKKAIADTFADYFGPNARAMTITPRDVFVQELGEVAIVTAHLSDLPTTPIRKASTFPRRTFVLRRSGDRWLIVHLHASNFQLVPSAPGKDETK